MQFQNTLTFAKELDAADTLKNFRDEFYLPKTKNGEDAIYMCGNSLGLQPKSTKQFINQELEDWKNLAVNGHTSAKNPWMQYNSLLQKNMAEIVGALPQEIVVMNTLTVNLHLMLVSFYNPTPTRNKILIEWNPFPSDRYALVSYLKLLGYDESCIIEPMPEKDSALISTDKIVQIIEEQGNEIALVMIGGVNYYSGQLYDIATITKAAKAKGCTVGYDLAHVAGNVPMQLHTLNIDFAIWCTYKYLNSGPGSLAACFIHEKHHSNKELHRLEGWWGNKDATRFKMLPNFDASLSAEGWQLSNAPILSMAAINASLQLFAKAGIHNLRKKSIQLTNYLAFLLEDAAIENINIITPKNEKERGCQISMQLKNKDKNVFVQLSEKGIIADWREPDVIRIAPTPMYNCFEDVWRFVEVLKSC
jgi:kynureninase